MSKTAWPGRRHGAAAQQFHLNSRFLRKFRLRQPSKGDAEMSSKEAGPSRLGAEVAGAKDRTKTPVQPAPVPPSYDGEEQPTAGAVSDDSDDEVADFRMLLPQLIAEKNKNGSGSAGVSGGSIPKRGEKDFEPTGFRGQEKKLEESRRAMEMVIGQERRATRSVQTDNT